MPPRMNPSGPVRRNNVDNASPPREEGPAMRYVWLLPIALVAVIAALADPRSAYAAFHCMRIHAIMAGFNGDNTIQYVELRMNAVGQSLVSGHQIKFYANDGLLKATFTFPGNVATGSLGDSILVGTQEFNNATLGGDADFTFSMANTVGSNGGDPLHPVQGAEGRVTFAEGSDNCDADFIASPGEVDSITYNDSSMSDLSAHFGTPATPLPSPSDNTSLRLADLLIGSPNPAPSNNSAEYSLQA